MSDKPSIDCSIPLPKSRRGKLPTVELFGYNWCHVQPLQSVFIPGYVAGLKSGGTNRINITAIKKKYGGSWMARTTTKDGVPGARVWCVEAPDPVKVTMLEAVAAQLDEPFTNDVAPEEPSFSAAIAKSITRMRSEDKEAKRLAREAKIAARVAEKVRKGELRKPRVAAASAAPIRPVLPEIGPIDPNEELPF